MENIIWDLAEFQGQTVGDVKSCFLSWIERRPIRSQGHWGRPIGSIPLRFFNPGLWGLSSQGLYVFFRASGPSPTVFYVGKATSRGFLERIPAHIEPNPECWFNTLTQRCVTRTNDRQVDHVTASRWCSDNLSVALIPIDTKSTDKSNIELFERRLRHPLGLGTIWNSCSQKARGHHIVSEDGVCNEILPIPHFESPSKLGSL